MLFAGVHATTSRHKDFNLNKYLPTKAEMKEHSQWVQDKDDQLDEWEDRMIDERDDWVDDLEDAFDQVREDMDDQIDQFADSVSRHIDSWESQIETKIDVFFDDQVAAFLKDRATKPKPSTTEPEFDPTSNKSND